MSGYPPWSTQLEQGRIAISGLFNKILFILKMSGIKED